MNELPKFQAKIAVDQLALLHRNLLVSIPANFICALVAFFGLHQTGEHDYLKAWLAAVLFISICRLIMLKFYYRHPQNITINLVIFIIGMALSAILWGLMGSVLMPHDSLLEQMIIVVIIAGVTAGGIQTLNGNLIASLIYISLIITPLTIWLLMQPGSTYLVLGLTLLTYLSFMIITSVRSCRLLEKTLRLQYENLTLVENLTHLREILYEQSIRDPLTGLYNRRYLDEVLLRELSRTIREKKSLCVAMLDLDFFKKFNDANGHEAGDEVLKLIGNVLKQNFRGGDIAFRYGGEEFLVVMTDAVLSSAYSKLEGIRNLIKKQEVYYKKHLLPFITVSIGIAEAPQQAATVKDIIDAADKALYVAKQSGRDRVECYDLISID